MGDIKSILAVIDKIKTNCTTIDKLKSKIAKDYADEEGYVRKKEKELIDKMEKQLTQFLEHNFYYLEKDITDLLKSIGQDYYDIVIDKAPDIPLNKYEKLSFKKKQEALVELITSINSEIDKLNKYDFNKHYPPLKIEIDGESFVTYYENKPEEKTTYNYDSSKQSGVVYPKPVASIVQKITELSYSAVVCIESIAEEYIKEFNIENYKMFVKNNANSWLKEIDSKLNNSLDQEFDNLFINEKAGVT